jgi:O-antigen ligase
VEVIALFPAVLAVVVAAFSSPVTAFLNVYVPVLLLIPDHFRWRIPGLPDPGFQHTAILPIAAILLFSPRRAPWRFSFTDVLVLLYAGLVGYSEYHATGWWEAQNLLLDEVCTVLLPYMLAKLILQPANVGHDFARRFTVCLAIVAVLSIWEFRMGTRLFFETPWSKFFPDAAPLPTQYRWGFGRIGGPFTHAILAGMIFGVGLFLQAWLLNEGAWKKRSTGLLVLMAVILGALLTMSRGPWLGIALGGCVALLGFVRDRTGTLLRLCLVALVVVPPVWKAMEGYTSVSSLEAGSLEQGSAAYRKELLDFYVPKVWEQPEFGYGAYTWPVDPLHPSIDNHYLLLALKHGVTAVVLLVAIFGWVVARLALYGAMHPPRDRNAGLAFTLAGGIASLAVGIATAYLGAQTEPILFLLVGWSESLLAYGNVRAGARDTEPQPARPAHSFQRVLT